jgi:hypothetical protein
VTDRGCLRRNRPALLASHAAGQGSLVAAAEEAGALGGAAAVVLEVGVEEGELPIGGVHLQVEVEHLEMVIEVVALAAQEPGEGERREEAGAEDLGSAQLGYPGSLPGALEV